VSDDLLASAEWVRVEATLSLSADAQSARGQYFTPERAAALIAAMPSVPDVNPIRVLDPGAGSGMLTAAIIERLVTAAPGRRVEVTAIEVDPTLIAALRRTAELCEQWARRHSAEVSITVINGDIITLSTGLEARLDTDFDIVIMNPPYKKLGANSPERRALASLGWDATNLYTACDVLYKEYGLIAHRRVSPGGGRE